MAEVKTKEKAKVAIFKLSSCGGCQLQLIDAGEDFLKLLDHIEIVYFPIAKSENAEGPYDVVLVEGSVCSAEEIEHLRKIRASTKYLVALGSCACFGGLQSIRNFEPTAKLVEKVYGGVPRSHPTKSFGIDEYVRVDAYVVGCPVEPKDVIEVIKSLLMGVRPRFPPYSVCAECKLRENECFLLKGIPCMGPVTAGGCNALCPSLNKPCEGCRGPTKDPNFKSLAKLLFEIGLKDEDVRRKFRKYAAASTAFAGVGL